MNSASPLEVAKTVHMRQLCARSGYLCHGRGYLVHLSYPDAAVPTWMSYQHEQVLPGLDQATHTRLLQLTRSYDPHTSYVLLEAAFYFADHTYHNVQVSVQPLRVDERAVGT